MQKLYGILSLLMICGNVDAMKPGRRRSVSAGAAEKISNVKPWTLSEIQLRALAEAKHRKRFKNSKKELFSDFSELREDYVSHNIYIDLLPNFYVFNGSYVDLSPNFEVSKAKK
ncbi:MAG TPA: hypothetical protein VEK38_01565 [Candidatus Bathyarchaeia archaeon]|nr:hypothetical protein [Candidatus Bathyarchaeia archaeon]